MQNTQTTCDIIWDTSLEVELRPRKWAWLKEFSKPSILACDVTALGGTETFDYVSVADAVLPTGFMLGTFGFSCKDLSTFNNHSGDIKSTCIDTGEGTTGASWHGKLQMVTKSRPMMCPMENVPSVRKGRNHECMQRDLTALGYATPARSSARAQRLPPLVPVLRARLWAVGSVGATAAAAGVLGGAWCGLR